MNNQNTDRGAIVRKICLKEVGQILDKDGFQTERISTAGWLPEPILIVHENEVVLLGSRHYDGKTLFLEMKRFFAGVSKDVIDVAIKNVSSNNPCVEVIRWEDGSWSFRAEINEDVDATNFIEKMIDDLKQLKVFVNRVEDQDGVGCEPWSITTQQRHYFIHENLDMSLRLANLNI